MSRYGETCVLNRHRCPYAHQNNHYTRSRSRSRSRSRGRRRERSRSRGRYNSNIYGNHRRKRKPAQESVIDRHRKELEEISATGAIELWGLSPREPPPDCDDEPTKMALPADRMKRTRESESESEEDSSEEKKKKKKHKKCSKKKLRKSHYKKKSKKHHKKKVHQMSSSESDDESDEEDTDMESQESWIEKQKDKDKEGGDGVIGPLPLMQDAGNQDITERHVITNSATPVCRNKGKDNFARLCCAFIEVGKLVLTKICEKVCSQKELDSLLKDDTILRELTSLRKEEVLSRSQWFKLYPLLRRSSSVSFRDFDPPLQLLLLRSIFGLNFTASGRDSFPPETDTSPVAGLTCLKVLRDRIHRHDAIGSVDDPTFNSYWSDMKIIFVRFGGRRCLKKIRYPEVYRLDEDLGEEFRKQLREWMRDDVSTEDKLGEEPKHGGAAENAKIGPPELSIHISKISKLPKDFSGWESGRLPVDILLFTVEEVEFLSCYVFLKNPIKSYHIDIGVVYFSSMEDKQGHKVKIALMRCSKVHDGPGGALSAAKDAILLLRPKAIFSVGTCRGIESTTIKPGDVIVSSKVITLDFKIPPKRHCLKLLGHLAAGWTPPLRNANEYEVKVHPGALISIPKVNEDIIRQYSEAIGLDKDGGGISTAANDLGTEWLIVKGIEGFKNDSQSSNNKWKEFASLMAASLVDNFLNDPYIFQDWPRLNAPSAFR